MIARDEGRGGGRAWRFEPRSRRNHGRTARVADDNPAGIMDFSASGYSVSVRMVFTSSFTRTFTSRGSCERMR